MRWWFWECVTVGGALAALALGRWWVAELIVRGPAERPAPRIDSE